MTSTDTMIGRTFDRRYLIMRKLGSGGMADVYLAEDQELGPPRRAQAAERAARARRAVRRAVPARGAERRRAQPPEHRLDLRPRPGRGHLLHRDGVPRRAHAQGAARPQRADADPDRDRLRAPDPRRARVRAPQRHRPPRHQAAQHRRRPRRAAEGDGLRHRALGRVADDRGRLDRRHGAVPLARAGARRSRSTRAPTSTRSGSCSTRCSPARCRSPATRRSRSR